MSAVSIYNNPKQAQFNALISQARTQCKSDFNSFPNTRNTKLEMELQYENEDTIMEKLETIIDEFIED